MKRIGVITIVMNCPEFIEYQLRSLKKFFKYDFEFRVVNNAKDFSHLSNGNDESMVMKIQQECERLHIPVYRFSGINSCPSTEHAFVVNHVFDKYKRDYDTLMFIDNDMFLYNDLILNHNYNLMYVPQIRQYGNTTFEYMWPNFFVINTKDVNNIDEIDFGICYNCDSGGLTYQWLMKQDPGKMRKIKRTFPTNNVLDVKNVFLSEFIKSDKRNEFSGPNYHFFSETFEDCIYHFRSGSNWRKMNNNMLNDTKQKFIKTLQNIML